MNDERCPCLRIRFAGDAAYYKCELDERPCMEEYGQGTCETRIEIEQEDSNEILHPCWSL